MKKIIYTIYLVSSLFAQYEIEGRWHLVGYEDNVMYQFVDTELFADAGYRYTIYSTDGNFGDIDEGGGTPNPYHIEEDIITMDLFFGNIVSYHMNYRCDGQVVEFISIPYESTNSTLFREGYNFVNNECEEVLEECCEAASIASDNCEGLGCYIPQCTLNCDWEPMQCWSSTGYCWCVDESGTEIEGTSTPSWQGFPDCEEHIEECFDFTGIDFGFCDMLLGIGLINDECNYISGCDWTINGIDYSDLFFDSIDDCEQNCELNNECDLTTEDILGPYYFEDAPFRNVITHEEEPGERLFISGRVKQNDCENATSGSLIEIWQANDEGCYGIVEDCDTGNPHNDYYNLRGKFFSNENGDYTFESILPGYYGSRPRHIHIKITTPNGEVLVSQLYFEDDPFCEDDLWCQDADGRIISLEENESGLYGSIDLIINSIEDGIIKGDLNFDNSINIQDIVVLVGIIIGDGISNDFQIYSGDLNNDNNLDVLDIVQLVSIILN